MKEKFLQRMQALGGEDSSDDDFSADEDIELPEGICGLIHHPSVKQFLHFLSGCLTMYILYLLLVVGMGYESNKALYICGIGGIITSFGCAFSRDIRCILLLMLPSLFTGKGRTILMAYGFVLVMSGPMANLNHNMDVAGHSQACGSALALNQSHAVFELVTAPLSSIMDKMEHVLTVLRGLIKRMHTMYQRLVDAVKKVARAIESFFDWIKKSADRCFEKFGRPRKVCEEKFEEGVRNCRETCLFPRLCFIADLFSNLCVIADVAKVLCMVPAAVKLAASAVESVFTIAVEKIENEFYVDIDFQHEFRLDQNFSKSLKDIKDSMLAEVDARTEVIQRIMGSFNIFLSFSALFVVFKAMKYRKKYLVKDSFDNWYISALVEKIDHRREEKKKETLLPLRGKLGRSYIKPTSFWLARPEKRKLLIGLVFWGTNAGYALLVVLADFGAYSFLELVREHTELRVVNQVPGSVHLVVEGDGFLAKVYRLVSDLMDPSGSMNLTFDTTQCLPQPSPPDILNYKRILFIFWLCQILVFTEAYGLRLRHLIGAHYYPYREKERAAWLYHHLIRKKGSFFAFLSKRMKQTFQQKSLEPVSLRSRLAANSKLAAMILKYIGYEWAFCFSCSQPGMPRGDENFKYCENRSCKGAFCLECVMDLNGMCTKCMTPMQYDFELDISLEKDSSDEDLTSPPSDVENNAGIRAGGLNINLLLLENEVQPNTQPAALLAFTPGAPPGPRAPTGLPVPPGSSAPPGPPTTSPPPP